MKPFRIILPLAAIGIGSLVAKKLIDTKPEPRKWGAPAAQLHVDARRLAPTNFPIVIESQGTVQPRNESSLIPQVAAEIEWISPSFNAGGFFEKGDELIRLDGSDFKSALDIAKASVVQAEANLKIEEAQSEQAWENWRRLGSGEKPNPLVVREPQVAEAKANVTTAQARLNQAERDLQRTVIKAPYAGRILEKLVDVGQYVSPGTQLARIYAIDYVEIRLPLSDKQQGYLNLPVSFRGETNTDKPLPQPKVTLTGMALGEEIQWEGRIVRTEGAIDTRSRQLFAIAQVDDPYGRKSSSKAPLKVGQFVRAAIQGKVLENVFAIPRSCIRQGGEILVIQNDNKIQRRPIDPIFKNGEFALIREEARQGELLCLTALPYAVDGALVVPTIEGEGTRMLESQKPKGRPGGGKPEGKPGSKPQGAGGGKPAGAAKGDWGGKPDRKPNSDQ